MKSTTVEATNSRQAVARAMSKLGLPKGTNVKSVKYNKKSKKWKVTFK